MNNIFLDNKENTIFSSLKENDLKELIVTIENYFLEYRDTLNLPSNLTFGTEVEYEKILELFVHKYISKNVNNWLSYKDASLKSGGEIKSPIMTDTKENWDSLKKVCTFLRKHHADTFNNAGGHIHFGQQILERDEEAWEYFLKIYTVYECVLYRFMLGDKISARRDLKEYAKPVSEDIYYHLKYFKKNENNNIFQCLPMFSRFLCLNFQNIYFNDESALYMKRTIEFRGPNASTSEVIWQNNINAFAKLLISSKKKRIDMEFLDYKLEKEYVPFKDNEYFYNEINFKNALEFVDIIFDNNLDKVYFLRQYFKNFEENYGIKTSVKAKTFIK